MADEQKTVVAVAENADGILKPIDEVIVVESTGSKAWKLTRHETSVLWTRWWPVAVLGLCDVLTKQSADLQANKEAWAVRCGVLLLGVVSIVRAWAVNNQNKSQQREL